MVSHFNYWSSVVINSRGCEEEIRGRLKLAKLTKSRKILT